METDADYSRLILDHYRQEAERYRDAASSTMLDEITRSREVAGVLQTLEWLKFNNQPFGNLLDVGCGNGYLLELLRGKLPHLALEGLEYTPELVEIARGRDIAGCGIRKGDVRDLPYEDASFDIAVTERCVINVMDQDDQAASLREIGRVLRPGGHYLCLEAFTDGLAQLNAARTELGLDENKPPYHNLWFDKDWFLTVIGDQFQVIDPVVEGADGVPQPNFLSSHYFISRAVYPALTRADIVYNSHFVNFFSFLPPMGNYAAIQFWLLRRKQD